MTTVITKNSSTASAVPASGDLVQGELAVNVTDKKIFTKDSSGTVVKVVGQLGNQEPSAVAITGGTVAGVAQTGGTINNTPIGATTANAITGTLITATTGFNGPLTGAVTGNTTGTHTGAVVGNVTGNLTGNVTASSGSSTFNNVTINGTLDMDASSAATITNLPSPTNSGDAANKGYVDTQISNLVASAPSTLDTLNELAAALGNDASFSTTVTTSIAAKLPKSGGTMTGDIAMGTNKVTGLGAPTAGNDATTKTYVDTADNLKLNLSGGTMSGAIAMGTNKITGLGTPTAGTDATTKTYVDGILGSATAAATSAAAAATSETNAANSASAASTSASNASASASAAAASYDSFDDRYLGPKSSAPSVDNDGNALLTGALYWNSTSSDLWLWTGSAWTRSALSGTDYVAKSGDTMTGALNVSVSTSTDALRVTQTGTGNALLVEDAANPDSTPFVVDANGGVIVGNTTVTALNYTALPRFQVAGNSQATSALSSVFSGTSGGYSGSMLFGRSNGSLSSKTVVASGDDLGRIQFEGYDGTAFIPAASVISAVDGTPGTNDMPGRLVFSTTADGASSPTERMRIDNAGQVGIGATPVIGASLTVKKAITGAAASYGVLSNGEIQSTVTSGNMFQSLPTTQATSFTLTNLRHFYSNQSTIGAGSAVTNQYGFHAESTLTGATNNYGFYGNIAAGTGRYNFYAAGTADNYFAGETTVNSGFTIGRTTVTAPATTDGNVFSGTYTPTLTNTTNVAASTAYTCQYMRVGNTVTVSGRVDIDPTATGGTELRMTLPVASSMTLEYQLSGTFNSSNSNGGQISAETTADTARLIFSATDIANRGYYFTFTYRII